MYESWWFFVVYWVWNLYEYNENFGGYYCFVGGIKCSVV